MDGSGAHVRAKGKWKKVEIDQNFFDNNALEGFISLEELTDYELITSMPDSKDGQPKSKATKTKRQIKTLS